MPAHGNLSVWIFLAGYCTVFLLAFPLLVGAFQPNSSPSGTVLGALRPHRSDSCCGCDSIPSWRARLTPTPAWLFLFGASAAAASMLGWLTYRIAALFRRETPLVATRELLWLLILLAVEGALLFVVLAAIWIVGSIDFADEIPELMFLRLKSIHYLYIGAATAIVFAWVLISTLRGPTSSAMALALVQIIPASIVILLFLPVLMAQLQVAWSTPVLDCAPRGIPGYVPDMIDFTRLVLDALAAGALLGLKSAVGWQIATCAPLATSRLASFLVLVLNVVPAAVLMLLALQFRRLRNALRAAGLLNPTQTGGGREAPRHEIAEVRPS